jgi:hypothetical protein
MLTAQELEELFIVICLEGFFYGKISVLCASTRTKRFQLELFVGLGLYFGIFVIYLQYTSKISRTQIILFYALCLLCVLSTATIVSNLINLIFQVSNNSIFMNIIFLNISCSFVSVNCRFNFKKTQCQCYFALGLFKSQQAVVVTSSPNVS